MNVITLHKFSLKIQTIEIRVALFLMYKVYAYRVGQIYLHF